MPLNEAVAYMWARYHFKVSRATIYNWAKKGRKGYKLKTKVINGVVHTYPKWLDTFKAVMDHGLGYGD